MSEFQNQDDPQYVSHSDDDSQGHAQPASVDPQPERDEVDHDTEGHRFNT